MDEHDLMQALRALVERIAFAGSLDLDATANEPLLDATVGYTSGDGASFTVTLERGEQFVVSVVQIAEAR